MKLNLKLKNKKIIIITSAALVLLLVILLTVFLVNKNKEEAASSDKTGVLKVFVPDFLSVEEKTGLGIPVDTKIQAMTRNQDGGVMVYKVIKNDSDIVDPAQVKPISPRTLNR